MPRGVTKGRRQASIVGVTLNELDRWPDEYGRAWERKDGDAFVSCFAGGAVSRPA